MRAFWWLGTVLGWLGVALVVLSLTAFALLYLNDAPCPPPSTQQCGEGVAIAMAGLLWLAGISSIASLFGFAVRALASPQR